MGSKRDACRAAIFVLACGLLSLVDAATKVWEVVVKQR